MSKVSLKTHRNREGAIGVEESQQEDAFSLLLLLIWKMLAGFLFCLCLQIKISSFGPVHFFMV